MANRNGHQKVLDQLRADGLTTIFGNPGSSEEGLLDEISRTPDIRYVLGLQEAALVLMANGDAQATQKPTVVQLHCSVGLENAVGSLYQAFRKQRSPLVVIAGEAGVAYGALDAHMALDLISVARPVTKYAARAIHPGSLLRLLRRCIKMAATPPWGPVFLAVSARHYRRFLRLRANRWRAVRQQDRPTHGEIEALGASGKLEEHLSSEKLSMVFGQV